MTTKNQNRIGHFVLADGAVWKITNCLVNCLSENTEYECYRLNRQTGLKERRIFRKGDKLITGLYKTRERAELARQNERLDSLERFVDQLSETFDEVRNAYQLV